MNRREAIVLLVCASVLSGWVLIHELPEPTEIPDLPEPTEIPDPTEVVTHTPELTQPEPTATPTRRVTTGWQHGSGGSSSSRSNPAAPIPELPTCILMSVGLLYVGMWQRRW